MALSTPFRDAGITRCLIYALLFLCLIHNASAATNSRFTSLQARRLYHHVPALRSRDDDASCVVSCPSQAPSNFCCSNGNTCQLVASGTTAICCPKGRTCSTIQPIVCNVQELDPSKYPNSPILTTELDKSLPKCGSSCCPFGYSCGEGKICVLNIDGSDSASPSSSSSASSSTKTSVSTKSQPGEDASGTSTAPAESSTSATSSKDKGVNLVGLVTAITVASVCFLAGILILVWFKWGRKRALKAPTHHKGHSWSSAESLRSTKSRQASMLPRHLVLQRGTEDKFIVMPNDTQIWPPPRAMIPPRTATASPMELPASPVSLCMWQNLEHAEVKETKIAYVIPAKKMQTRVELG